MTTKQETNGYVDFSSVEMRQPLGLVRWDGSQLSREMIETTFPDMTLRKLSPLSETLELYLHTAAGKEHLVRLELGGVVAAFLTAEGMRPVTFTTEETALVFYELIPRGMEER